MYGQSNQNIDVSIRIRLCTFRCVLELAVIQIVHFFYQCRCYLLQFTNLSISTPNRNQFDTCVITRIDFIHIPR